MQEQDNIKTPSATDQYTGRQSSDIEDTNPDTKPQTVSSIPPKTAATAPKSTPILSDLQNTEQSHEAYISNQIREQLIQLGLSKEDIESKYDKYIPAAARAIIEKSNKQAEALYSLYRRFVNEWEAAAAETKISNRDDVTLEQEPINNGGKQPSIDEQTELFLPDPCWFIPDGTVGYNLDHMPKFRGELIESEYDDTLVQSYVAEVISQEEQTKIGDALVKATALATNKYRLNESISDIAAAFKKLARVLDIKCSENEDYFLVLFEIWRNLVEK